jgi:hypothetical protein
MVILKVKNNGCNAPDKCMHPVGAAQATATVSDRGELQETGRFS